MAMRQLKLLDRTQRIYALFSAVTLLVTAPLFFFLTRHVQLEEAEEMLMLRKYEFEKIDSRFLHEKDLLQWNTWNRDTRIEAATPGLASNTFANEEFPNIMDGDMEPYRVLRAPIVLDHKTYTFFSRISLLESEETLYILLLFYSGVLLCLFAGLYIITRKLSNRLWRPFHDLLNQLEEYDISRPGSIQYSPSRTDEFNRMNAVVEKLISRNVSAYKNQKEFIENAAHELQTPLAVMRSKLDNLMQEELSSKDASAIHALNLSLDRLTKLNRNMLLLSRMEYDAFHETRDVYVNEVLSAQLDFLSSQLELMNITLETSLEGETCLKVNPDLLEICISNLLSNAIRHNRENGHIHILLDKHHLSVSNTGMNGALDRDKLFGRFSGQGRGDKGNGLGLAIVKRISELNHWTIAYTFDEGMHTFILSFS